MTPIEKMMMTPIEKMILLNQCAIISALASICQNPEVRKSLTKTVETNMEYLGIKN